MTDIDSAAHKPMRQQVEEYIVSLQNNIVSAFEELDPSAPPFRRDSWVRPQGGRGQSCIFAYPSNDASGKTSGPSLNTVLEKAGVNISIVHGILPPGAIKQTRADHKSMPLPDHPGSLPFFAAGISLVIHPRNPHVPTVHANYRYFEITEPVSSHPPEGEGGNQDPASASAPPKILTWWFGGGSDLTPSYLYEQDVCHFHSSLKMACDAHGKLIYPTFKKWCDQYFYIPHRCETRGVGGFFFDDMNGGAHARLPSSDVAPRPNTPLEILNFVKDLGNTFIPS